MGASEKAVAAVMETLGCDPYWNTWVRPVRATCINRQHEGDWIPARGCPVAVAAADAAVDTDRPSIQAQALREAEAEFASRTQEAAGEVREHWRGQDFVDGQDTAYESASEWCGVKAEQLDRTRREPQP